METSRQSLITAIDFLRDNQDSATIVEYIATKYSAKLNPDKTLAQNAESLTNFLMQYTGSIQDESTNPILSATVSQQRMISPVLKADFNLERYMGRWFSAASIPQPFDRGTASKAAFYELSTEVDQKPVVIVTNIAYNQDGSVRAQILGTATVVDWSQRAALCVRFPTGQPEDCQRANYLVHDTNYQDYSIVGSYDGSNLYILVRRRPIHRSEYDRYVQYAASLGYDVSRFAEDYGAVQTQSR